MTPLTEKTITLVNLLFQNDSQAVQSMLVNECGQNLPFCEKSTPESLERLRFATLKIGAGNVDKFLEAIAIAKQDWRDLLVWAGFANDLEAHSKWADVLLTK